MNYIITFIEGLVSFISPCVLPMLPMYISYFAGQDKSLRNTIINAISFVLGFTVVFTMLGVFASTFGNFISTYINYINVLLGLIIIIFGLHYIGILNIKLLNKTSGIKNEINNLSVFTAFLFGIIFSICWTPCVGIFLSSALLMSATSGSVLEGTVMLILYSAGLGIPFIITAVFLEKLKSTFDFIKKNYDIINKIAGVVLIISGGTGRGSRSAGRSGS